MDRVLHLEVSARKKRILLPNDLIPAALLLFTGLSAVIGGSFGWVAGANILCGGLMVVFGVREWRSLSRREHRKVEWYDIVSGIVMIIDAATMYKPWKGFQPADLYIATGLFIILRGFAIIKFDRSVRRLILSDQGFSLRMGLFSSFRFGWNEILQMDRREHLLTIVTSEGPREISLGRVSDPEKIQEEIFAYWTSKKESSHQT